MRTQEVAAKVCQEGHAMTWTTPIGLKVVQPYKDEKESQVSVHYIVFRVVAFFCFSAHARNIDTYVCLIALIRVRWILQCRVAFWQQFTCFPHNVSANTMHIPARIYDKYITKIR